ncbi:MAG: hypothetical protein OEZ65_09430 [Gemmatimonadota bacterium]|nr:hypothetical protein [Gemmatimonadota bacterium]MDH5759796.1 hypothetical protein [Gemmatimonadota bacterium]
MRFTSLVTICAVLPCVARPVLAQTPADLMEAVRVGGGWISVPIVAGVGQTRTVPLPTFGLTLSGCVQVWGGHSGDWRIEARDTHGDGTLDLHLAPGESAPFSYRAGMSAQLEVRYQWSERRDTTLLLWVGLASQGSSEHDGACEPRYSDEGRSGAAGDAAPDPSPDLAGGGDFPRRNPYLPSKRGVEM